MKGRVPLLFPRRIAQNNRTMAEPLPSLVLSNVHVTRKRWTWKMSLLALLSTLSLPVAWHLQIHNRYREQLEAIAVVERLGGSVSVYCDAPEWLQRLQPDRPFRLDGIGPRWLREYLPFETVVKHFLVVEAVYADEGPGSRPVTNLSGQRRDVDSIRVTDDDLEHIGKFTHLERLYLRHMPVTDAGMEHLRNLRHLRHLYLSYTQITDQSAEILAGFERLEKLRLLGTQVSDQSIVKLSGLRHLEELDVRKTRVTKRGLDPFRSRPGLNLLANGPDDPYRGAIFSY